MQTTANNALRKYDYFTTEKSLPGVFYGLYGTGTRLESCFLVGESNALERLGM